MQDGAAASGKVLPRQSHRETQGIAKQHPGYGLSSSSYEATVLLNQEPTQQLQLALISSHMSQHKIPIRSSFYLLLNTTTVVVKF